MTSTRIGGFVLSAILAASPALAQEWQHSMEWIWASPLTTNIYSGNCMFLSIGPAGDVTVDRACLERAAAEFKPGKINSSAEATAYLLSAVMNKNYSEVSK